MKIWLSLLCLIVLTALGCATYPGDEGYYRGDYYGPYYGGYYGPYYNGEYYPYGPGYAYYPRGDFGRRERAERHEEFERRDGERGRERAEMERHEPERQMSRVPGEHGAPSSVSPRTGSQPSSGRAPGTLMGQTGEHR